MCFRSYLAALAQVLAQVLEASKLNGEGSILINNPLARARSLITSSP